MQSSNEFVSPGGLIWSAGKQWLFLWELVGFEPIQGLKGSATLVSPMSREVEQRSGSCITYPLIALRCNTRHPERRGLLGEDKAHVKAAL